MTHVNLSMHVIQDQAVERDKDRARLLLEAKATIPVHHGHIPTGGKDRKRHVKSEFSLTVGPAARNTRAALAGSPTVGSKGSKKKTQQSASTSSLPRISS